MITSIGLDIVETARIKDDLERFGPRFSDRILGPDEKVLFDRRQDKPLFLAGRFAAKEAVVKALGKYLTVRPPLQELQIVNDQTGRPELKLPDSVRESLDGARCFISISHERNYAAAVAIFEDPA